MRFHERSPAPRVRGRLALVLLLVVFGGVAVSAALRTSTTFDEILLVSAGARMLETGSPSLVFEQPPLMPILYGLAVRLSGPEYPSEVRERMWSYDERWEYARTFFFRVGNDPERLALLSRLVAVAAGVALVAATWAWGFWISGPVTAFVAAFLVAFLPDVVAHSGVAYNDVPLALTYLVAVWALDAAVRRPGVARGAVAGLAVAVAVGVKFSALALGPVALVLVLLEAAGRERTRPESRGRDLLVAGVAASLAGWAALVLMYRGDFLLVGLEYGLRFTVEHASEGHPAPAWLFGSTSPTGWWYFFPAAFLVKAPAALLLLGPVAAVGGWLGGRASRRRRGGWRSRIRAAARSRLRGPVVGVLVFSGFLLASSLNIGFRYALPALPPLLLLVAVGLSRLWSVAGTRRRAGMALLLALYAGSTLTAHPWYLSYRSEWFRTLPPGEEPLLDSSLDWGHGLLALREWMTAEGVERVRISYFGSALPGGYGIDHEPLPGFLPLPDAGARGEAGSPPEWVAVSATNLHGLYLQGDPFAALRERPPDVVLAGSLYLYREPGPGGGD